VQWLPALFLGVFVGGGAVWAGLWIRNRKNQATLERARLRADALLKEAETRSELTIKEAEVKAKGLLAEARDEAEREIRELKRELGLFERKLQERETTLEKRVEVFERRESEIARREQQLREREGVLEHKEHERQKLIEEAQRRLESVAGLTAHEAKRLLLDEMIEQARHDAAKHIRLIEEEAREEADRRAKRVVAIAIERLAGDFVAERTVSALTLPSDDMKGRIIGREGRNIRAIEAATGVDIIVDDTPETVVISCHNPIRREIARVALERLIADGRIHPGRIEEVVRKAEQEVEAAVREAGQRALIELGIHGVHPELVKLLGMLKYRYSYGQNALAHSVETAFICGAMAAELGLNERQARRAGLLHDIGKALTHEVEGSHALIGAEMARKFGESAKIVNAIAAHHEEVKAETILAPLVDAADALSAARPGARRETIESYVKRVEELEQIAKSFPGVEKCFAMQAGRELRIMVEPGKVSDDESALLAREVARRIENEMTYPGQVRVTVIRETRASEIAR
jgi:ribonuclease Y